VLVLNERDPLHPKTGGAETHVSEIFGRLARRGYEVTHFASGFAGGASEERVNDVLVRRFGALPRYYPSALLHTRRETRAGRYDVVVECLNKVPFYSPVYASAPVLALCHHLFGDVAFQQVAWPIAATVWTSERLIPALYRACQFIAISESSRADLVRRGLSAEKVMVSHPGIDRPGCVVETDRPRGRRIVYLGRLEAYKRVDVMLRALAQLADRLGDVEIVIIGRGPARERLESLAREIGLADRTTFTGFVSNDERDALLADARVCVCPSEKEGWGLTVIEANALGVPVVATDADGLRDSVRDGETGFLVEDANVAQFAERIGRLLDDDALATKMSAAALEWSRRFDWDIAADDMARAIALARGRA
jgi:glycosyltransferase involved in cell wall biosynthesis